MIKAVIFDLDDTLFSNLNQLHLPLLKQGLNAMIKEGLGCSPEEGFEQIAKINMINPFGDPFRGIAERYSSSQNKQQSLAEIGKKAYNDATLKEISLFPNAGNILKKLKEKYRMTLITCGNKQNQEKKIEKLGIKESFNLILLCNRKTEYEFERILKTFKLSPNEVVCIGNRIDSEIAIAKKMGMTTVYLKHGKYSNLIPENDDENPDYTINDFSEVLEAIRSIENASIDEELLKKGPKVVAIGGGTGLPTLLDGLKRYTSNITAIVTVADSGRSSGRLRKEFGVLPPGDIRNCLIALSRCEKTVHDLFQYRFKDGALEGHTVGNLFITALTKITGSFEKSVRETSKILNLRGKVLPSTIENVNICAELEDGTIIEEEANVRKPNKSKIKRLFMKPENAEPLDESLKDIMNADVIILGPGALYTSVLPNLLIKGIPEALKLSKAKKIYICNIMTQPGETDDFTVENHVTVLENYLGEDILDYVIVNNKKPFSRLIQNYKKENKSLVMNDPGKLEERDIKVIEADIIEKSRDKLLLWEKSDLLRHDNHKLAKIIIQMLIKEKIFEVTKQNESSDSSSWKRNKNVSSDKRSAKGSG